MKKSLLALVFAAALAVPAMAENMWVGGSFSYENSSVSNSDGDGDSNMFTIEPEFGISLDEKWDIGLDLAYGSGKGEIFEVKSPINKIDSYYRKLFLPDDIIIKFDEILCIENCEVFFDD